MRNNSFYFSILENSELQLNQTQYFDLGEPLKIIDKKIKEQNDLKSDILSYTVKNKTSSNVFYKLKYFILNNIDASQKSNIKLIDLTYILQFLKLSKNKPIQGASNKMLFYFSDISFSLEGFNIQQFSYLSLVLRVTLNNIFLTLINKQGEVLVSLSGGRVGMKGFNRRSQTSLKLMLKKLISFLKKNRLENKLLFFFVKTNWLSLKRIVVNDLFSEGVELNYIIFDIARCHNGLRKRKLRNR